jgi:hypothetical protein
LKSFLCSPTLPQRHLRCKYKPVSQICTEEAYPKTRTLNFSNDSNFGTKRMEIPSRFYMCLCIFNLHMCFRFVAPRRERDRQISLLRNSINTNKAAGKYPVNPRSELVQNLNKGASLKARIDCFLKSDVHV